LLWPKARTTKSSSATKAFKSSEADTINALKARIAAMQKQQQNVNRAKITQHLFVLLILD